MSMTTGSETVQGTNTAAEQMNRVINIASPIALQLIVNNCDRAAAYYRQLFGAKVLSGQIIPGVANQSDASELGNAADGSDDALATKTVVIGNTAINLVSKKAMSSLLNVPVKRLGEQKKSTPIVITINVDDVAQFLERATQQNAEIVQGLTTNTEGHQLAYIRGQEGYVWCLTNTTAINAAGGATHSTTQSF
jgi:uncharacterized glyoxalase superfamily protein PhnB